MHAAVVSKTSYMDPAQDLYIFPAKGGNLPSVFDPPAYHKVVSKKTPALD